MTIRSQVRDLLTDLGYAMRLFRRAPGVTATAVATLAIGIGATTAMFTVVHAVLLRPLPYQEPSRLVILRAEGPGAARGAALADGEIADVQDAATLFSSVGAIVAVDGNLTGTDAMERVPAASVTDGFFPTLGVTTQVGRLLENRIDSTTNRVLSILISDELWRRRFNADPTIVGRQIDVNNMPLTVVGVLPKAFRVYLGPDTSVPARIDVWFPTDLGTDRRYRSHTAIARLASGATLAGARAELDAIGRRAGQTYRQAYGDSVPRFFANPLHEDTVRASRPALLALMGAVAFVLLIACANVANLLLARTAARGRELAVRGAIGATRGRLVRQLLAEGVLLGAAGGAAGLLLALWGQATLERVRPAALPSMPAQLADVQVLGFALAVTMAAAVAFSLAPALTGMRAQPSDALKSGGRGGTSPGSLRGVLIVAEVALSILLLTGAGLMIRTVAALRSVDTGFDPQHVLTLQAQIQPRAFRTTDEKWRIYADTLERLRQLPGVEHASAVRPLPLEGMPDVERLDVEGVNGEIIADTQVALPDFFDTMRIVRIRGRDLETADVVQRRNVVIVDEQFAREAWGTGNPLGRRIRIRRAGTERPWSDVVGVVSHIRSSDMRSAGRAQVYLPYHALALYELAVVLRTTGDPLGVADAARRTIESLRPGRPVHHIRPMTAYVEEHSADARFALLLLGVFAAMALLLSAVGIYGVVAVSTALRTREFGVRIALGSDRAGIVRLVLRDGLRWAGAGIGAGALGSFALARSLDALVYGVPSRDPYTFAAGATLLMAVAAVACYVPAARAARLEPVSALRAD